MTADDAGTGPLAELLGIRRTSMTGGRARFEVTVRPEHMNPHGVVHGAVVYALLDYAMGGALVSVLQPGERCTTLELKINYLTPVSGGEPGGSGLGGRAHATRRCPGGACD
jgi:acyl-CoA thioesterase